jgi:hypothetical protein
MKANPETQKRVLSTKLYFYVFIMWHLIEKWLMNKGNNKITELRTILQRESQNS